MDVFVEVLYSDLKRRKEKLEDIAKLPKDNVLFILVEDDQREGKLKNIASCFGFDHYALCQKRDNSEDWIMLFGWDDDDFIWRRISKCDGCRSREVVDAPIGVMHVIFRGGKVSAEDWNKAKKIINKELI